MRINVYLLAILYISIQDETNTSIVITTHEEAY